MMAARGDAAGGTSSARRRRERRLRSWAKHERLSVAMALAEKLHHSANRTVLPKKKEVEQDCALRGLKPARAGPGTQFLFVGGVSVPEPVGEAQLQARVQRHTVEQRIEHTPYVQIRRWRTSCWLCSGPSTARLPSRLSKCPSCRVIRVLPVRLVWEPQMANTWWMCRRCCRMPCSSSGMWSKSLTFQFLLVVVVVFKILSRQDSTASSAEQIADSPFGGGLHGFLPGQVSTASASGVEQLVDSSSGGLQGFSPGHESRQRSAE